MYSKNGFQQQLHRSTLLSLAFWVDLASTDSIVDEFSISCKSSDRSVVPLGIDQIIDVHVHLSQSLLSGMVSEMPFIREYMCRVAVAWKWRLVQLCTW